MYPPHSSFYEFGHYLVDINRRLLLQDGQLVPLTPKVFDTLVVLLRNGSQVIRKEALMKEVWPDSYVEEGNLSQNISVLRKTLGEKLNEHSYIVTVPGVGYRFVSPVREIPDEPSRLPKPGNHASFFDVSRVDAGRGVVTRGQPAPEARPSVVVLPLQTLNQTADDEFIGLGIADAIITRLGSLHQFVVSPTSTIRQFNGKITDPVAFGQKLNASFIFEGSLQKFGDRLRVTLQLVRVADEITLWAGKFDEQFADLFAIQDLISEQAAAALTGVFAPDEQKQIPANQPENTAASQALLKGQYYLNKRTESFLIKAIEAFEQAITCDTSFAPAYSGIAAAQLLLVIYGDAPPMLAMPKARDAALRALELDDSLAEAHAVLATTQALFNLDLPSAERGFKRALELDPNCTNARQWYASHCLSSEGRFEEALEQLRLAQETDPLAFVVKVHLSFAHLQMRRYDEVIEGCRLIIEIEPQLMIAHLVLGRALTHKGQSEEAISSLRQAVTLSQGSALTVSALGYACAVAGKKTEAHRILARLHQLALNRYVPSYFRAVIHAALGEKEAAFAELERALAERCIQIAFIKVDPMLDSLRGDPAFDLIVHRAGRSSGNHHSVAEPASLPRRARADRAVPHNPATT